jgi:hypothetical protein
MNEDTTLYGPPAMKATPLSPRQIESRMKIFAKGRKHFILYRGILGWGLTCFIGTTVCEWYGKYGWYLPPRGVVVFDVLSGWLLVWNNDVRATLTQGHSVTASL